MVCIYCRSDTQVVNSRHQKRLNQIWRRRKCLGCGNITTSHEIFDLATSVSVEAGNTTLQPFQREKLLLSIYESCRHRPNALPAALSLTQTIISELLGDLRHGKIARSQIITTAVAVLQRFDSTAAAVYQAYHR